jgi:hypothetical protein
MKAALRSIAAVVIGVIAALVIITLAQMLTVRLYPMTAGVNPQDQSAMIAWIQQLPAAALVIVLCGWALGAFVGGFISGKFDRAAWARQAVVIGILLLAAGVWNMTQIPYPIWMWVGAFVVFVPAAWAGARAATR